MRDSPLECVPSLTQLFTYWFSHVGKIIIILLPYITSPIPSNPNPMTTLANWSFVVGFCPTSLKIVSWFLVLHEYPPYLILLFRMPGRPDLFVLALFTVCTLQHIWLPGLVSCFIWPPLLWSSEHWPLQHYIFISSHHSDFPAHWSTSKPSEETLGRRHAARMDR